MRKKRLTDLFIIILLLPLILAVILVLCLLQKCIQGGSVFFKQERLGLNGRPFIIYKFRSMEVGIESDAQRLTKWGRFLRSTSLDELPEFYNILKGDMSLVGPRPLPSKYKYRYTKEQYRRHQTLPGILDGHKLMDAIPSSGSANLNSILWYVDNHSIMLDLKILFATIGAVRLEKYQRKKSSNPKRISRRRIMPLDRTAILALVQTSLKELVKI